MDMHVVTGKLYRLYIFDAYILLCYLHAQKFNRMKAVFGSIAYLVKSDLAKRLLKVKHVYARWVTPTRVRSTVYVCIDRRYRPGMGLGMGEIQYTRWRKILVYIGPEECMEKILSLEQGISIILLPYRPEKIECNEIEFYNGFWRCYLAQTPQPTPNQHEPQTPPKA